MHTPQHQNPHDATCDNQDQTDQMLSCQCSPARRIEADQTTIERGTIVCGICLQPFTIQD